MKRNARKWVTLDKLEIKHNDIADKCEQWTTRNYSRAELHKNKMKEISQIKSTLEKLLTNDEKKEIELYYQCGQMFDYN